ncbi:rRNA processing/ribosome biogenesis-domain-containing protein [Pseudomassariella vexata]|uniref:Pre-rRNA-processing protein RIX1 n=1 Tax=Pseudomassariella vexata TaxID=1141098 RepID=A0A1Y2EE35_9PEZI|nr:rRNA processing/ribosome biogenesis-domain-containing protein [Pseudomassariella vexata]ORY69574.1 rRNA processing/ribosome biogenesis-domain-containing protein [Pseudomassariella vexata]
MSLVTLPPELRSLCRKLTSTKPEHLPNLLPFLLQDVQRCRGPLSEPLESKSSANGSEAAVLVHKLKTQVTTLLNGRSVQGRFAAVALVKAIIEAGGWQSLSESEPWVRGLLIILQKRGPIVIKELCVVTLTKIYMMIQRYQTLVRQIVTPTLPGFATACIQILKPTATSKAAKAPLSFNDTVFEAFSSLIPLFPTTLRPFAAQIRNVARPYLAPTTSDGQFVPEALQRSSRRLVVRLHMTAAKGGGSDEWAKHLTGLVKDVHNTADQVFRAVQETWESSSGYVRQAADFSLDPTGGGTSPDQLPEWTGVQAGSERIVGLLRFIGESLRCKTKTPVTIPVSSIFDLTRRISSIILRTSATEKSESTQMNAAVGREEKDELWSVFPDVQVAAMRLLSVLAQRLGRNFLPLAQETLDQILRMFDASYRLPEIRSVAFALSNVVLQLCRPSMTKINVDSLTLTIQSCCQDLLGAGGHLRVPRQQATMGLQNGSKSNNGSQNADSFLPSQSDEETLPVILEPEHKTAAEELLVTLFSNLPQQYINSSLRSRMLRTAILCRIKKAQVASVLHPARDKNGRTADAILPYLHQQFPHDEIVEILRFNLRPTGTGAVGDFMDHDDGMGIEYEASVDNPANGSTFDKPFEAAVPDAQGDTVMKNTASEAVVSGHHPVAEVQPSPFSTHQNKRVTKTTEVEAQLTSVNPLKRKTETDDIDVAVSKRVEVVAVDTTVVDHGFASVGTIIESSLGQMIKTGEDADNSDDESVHLQMELDESDDDAEEEEE